MPNLIVAAARALERRQSPPVRDVTARAPVAVGPRNQMPTTVTNLFSGSEALRALDAYENSSAVHSVVLRRASDAARIPWCLYRNTPGQSGLDHDLADQREEIQDHAFLRVWRRPNPRDNTGRKFRQLMLMYLDVMGEATAVVATWGPGRDAQPAELWPIRPDRLVPIPDPVTGIAGWIHTSEDGERTPLRTDQVVQIKFPNLRDPLRGLGPVQAAMLEIDASVLSTEWFRNFYLNNAQPGGIVTTEEHMTQPQFDEWAQRWNEQHGGGPANAHRVALMDAGAKWLGAQMSMLDMQFVDMVKANRDAVFETFGMPKVILGNGDVNRASALAIRDIYARYPLQDRVDLLSELANVELLPRYGSARVPPGAPPKFVLEPGEPVVPADVELDNADRDSRIGAAAAMVAMGGDPEEVCEAFSLPKVTFRDPQPVPAQFTTPADGDDDTMESEGQDPGQNAGSTAVEPEARARAVVAAIRAAVDPLDDAPMAPDPDVPLDRLQDEYEVALQVLLADYVELEQLAKDDVLAQLERLLTDHGLDGLDHLRVNMSGVADRLYEAMVAQADVGADDLIAQAGADGFRIEVPAVDTEQLRRAANGIAQILGNRLSSSAKGAVLRAWSADNEA